MILINTNIRGSETPVSQNKVNNKNINSDNLNFKEIVSFTIAEKN